VCFQAGLIAQGGGQMGFADPDAAQEDDVGLIGINCRRKRFLTCRRLIFLGQLQLN